MASNSLGSHISFHRLVLSTPRVTAFGFVGLMAPTTISDTRTNDYYLISIVVTSFNHSAYISECIASLMGILRTHSSCLVLIDDGSSDNTVDIAERLLLGVPNVLLVTKENRGLIDSLRLSLSLINSTYVYFISADDCVNPLNLVKLLSSMRLDPFKRIAMGNLRTFGSSRSNANIYGAYHSHFFLSRVSTEQILSYRDLPKPLFLQSAIFKLSELLLLDPWRNDIEIDDLSLFLMFLKSHSFCPQYCIYRPSVTLAYYRIHESNYHKKVNLLYSRTVLTIKAYAVNRDLLDRDLTHIAILYVLSSLRRLDLLMASIALNDLLSFSRFQFIFSEILQIIFQKLTRLRHFES